MKKRIIGLCCSIIILCIYLLVNEEKKPEAVTYDYVRVALSQAESLTPWKTAQINSMRAAAGERGIDFIYHMPAEETIAWQLQDIQELLQSGIDYLILIPKTRTGYDQILLEAKKYGVTVILAEREIEMDEMYPPESYYTSFAIPDYFREGELCAEILSEYFGAEMCHAIVMMGDKASGMEWERYMGFMHGVREARNMYVSKRVEVNGDRVNSQKITEMIVTDEEVDFNAVFAPSAEDGLGALQALKFAGVESGADVVIVSVEGTQDVLKAIISGEYLAAVKSDAEYGEAILDWIERHYEGKTLSEFVAADEQIYTKENAGKQFEEAY